MHGLSLHHDYRIPQDGSGNGGKPARVSPSSSEAISPLWGLIASHLPILKIHGIIYAMRLCFLMFTVMLFLTGPLAAQAPDSDDDTRTMAFFSAPGIPLVGASSHLYDGSSWKKYHESNLFDRSEKTAWVEGIYGTGLGEKVRFAVPAHIESLELINGYAASEKLFIANGRVRTLRISLHAGCTTDGMVSEIGPVFESIRLTDYRDVSIRDTIDKQTVLLDIDWNEAADKVAEFHETLEAGGMPVHNTIFYIEAEIASIYPGEKWMDTCIAEIDWTYEAGYQGPEGIRHADIVGPLYVETGAEWDVIILLDDVFANRYESYKDEELYDSGSWTFMNGTLIMESDGRGMTLQYDRIIIDGCSIIFVDDEGKEIRYRRGA